MSEVHIHTNPDEPNKLGKLVDSIRSCVGAFTLMQLVSGGIPPADISLAFVTDLERLTLELKTALAAVMAAPPTYTVTDEASARDVARQLAEDQRVGHVRSTVRESTIFGPPVCSSRRHMFEPPDAAFCCCGALPNPR